MFPSISLFFQQILLSAFLKILLVVDITAILVGVGLMLRPALIFRLFAFSNRTIVNVPSPALDTATGNWPSIQRYRFFFAVLIACGSAYTAIRLAYVDTGLLTLWLSHALHMPLPATFWLVNLLKWFLILGSGMGLAVGLLLGFSLPTLIKLEARLAKWLEKCGCAGNKNTKARTYATDNLVAKYPKSTGLIMTVMSIIATYLVWKQLG